MLRKLKGMTLLEVMIAGIILVAAVGFFVISYVGFESRLAAYRYQYTGINLLRDCLEFGESQPFAHEFELTYSYSPNKGKYEMTHWWYFNPANPDPFDYMGDIKAKGLVPVEYPDEVKIVYEARQHSFPTTGSLYLSKARISWKENLPGRKEAVEREEELGVVPLNTYNNQLNLVTGRFWWEKR